MRNGSYCLVLIVMFAGCGGGGAGDDTGLPRGISADTITLGSHTDLSGGIAIWGVPVSNGQRMRYDEANENGGIHGRRIKLVVEDTQYQVPLAVKATNKLLNVDDIFLMVGSMGTPHNNAVTSKQFKAGVPNLFPVTASVTMYEPLHPMKFSYFVSYGDQTRAAMEYMVEKHDASKVCLQAAANDYGQEVVTGFERAVEDLGLESVYVGRHKLTETDFAGTITSIKNSGCEVLFLGSFIKDAILLYSAARDAGWEAPIVSNMVPYALEVATAADGGMDGFYSVAPFKLISSADAADSESWIGQWAMAYREQFGEQPVAQAQMGYVIADLVVRALEAAGPDVSVDKVLAALESIDHYEDPFGGPSLSFGPQKHQGSDYLNLYQVVDEEWQAVEEGLPY
jgi:branched-chain amino acid transport system substrate-binding protein